MSEALVNAHGHAEVGWSLWKANQAGGAPAASASPQAAVSVKHFVLGDGGAGGGGSAGAGNPLKVPRGGAWGGDCVCWWGWVRDYPWRRYKRNHTTHPPRAQGTRRPSNSPIRVAPLASSMLAPTMCRSESGDNAATAGRPGTANQPLATS